MVKINLFTDNSHLRIFLLDFLRERETAMREKEREGVRERERERETLM